MKTNLRFFIIITIIIVIIISTVFMYKIYNKSKTENNIISTTMFIPNQSLSVGTIVNFDTQIQDISNKIVNFKGKKVFIFANNRCGSCMYLNFPLVEWIKKFKEVDFYFFESSNQQPLIYSELKQESNFYTFVGGEYFNIFKNPATPSVFFIDENNKIVWKRTGFQISDYKEYEERIEEFSKGKYDFNDYQRNIGLGEIFPEIIYKYKDDVFLFPDDFKGEPTIIFFLFSSCKSCRNIIDLMTDNISKNEKINKVIVFADTTKETIEANLNFAVHFSLKDIEMQIKHAELYKYIDSQYILEKIKSFKNTVFIKDDFFFIPKMVGMVGGPYAFILNSEGKILSINSIGFEDPEILNKFFEGCIKILKEWR